MEEEEQEQVYNFEGSDGQKYSAKKSELPELVEQAKAAGVVLKGVMSKEESTAARDDDYWTWDNAKAGVRGIWEDPTGEHGALAYMGLNVVSGLGTAAGKVIGGMIKGAGDVGFGLARGVARGVESLVGADGHAVSGFLGDWHDSFNEITDALTPDIFEKRGMYDGIEGAHETMGAINSFAESVFAMKGMGLAAKGVGALAGGRKAAAIGQAVVAAGMGGKGYAEMAEDQAGPGGWRQELAAAAKGGIEAAMFGVLGPWKKMNMALPKPFEQLTKTEIVKRFTLEALKSGAMMAGVAATKEGVEALATAGTDQNWHKKSAWEVSKTVMSEFLVGSAFHAVNALGKSGAWLAWRADRKNGEGAITFQVEQNRKIYAPIMDRQARLALQAREVAARDPGAKWLEATTPGAEGTENVKAVAKDGSVQFDDGSVWRMGADGRATITVADGTILDARTGAVEGYRANREAAAPEEGSVSGDNIAGNQRAENAALFLDALERGELPTVAEPLEGLQITETSYKKGTVLDGEWDQAKAPPVVVWVGNDGTRVLITGRSRAAGAAAAGVKEIKAVEVREDQGWSRQQAESLDAVENMREGRGTREEIARGVEALGIRSVEDCDRYEIVPERPVVDAITVLNEGSEALKSAATEGTVGRAWAAECAEKLGKKSLGEASERAQATALDMIAGKLPPEEAGAAMDALAELAARKPDYTDREAADAIRAARERAVGRVAVDADSEMVEMPDGTIKSVAEAKAEGAAQAQEAAAEGKTVDESGWLPKAPAAPGADKAAEPTVKADGSVGCVRFEGAKATRTRSEDGREIVLVEGLTGEEMMRPENRDAAVQFITRLKEMAGDVDLVFADVSASDAAEALLMAKRVQARAEARSNVGEAGLSPQNQLVDAGQRLVDGLFGEKSGIRVRTGTREEAEAALRAAGETKPIKDAQGQVQGYYDRGKGEVVLFEGADAGTLAHEIGWHAVWHWAERNSPDLLLKMKRYAARTPQKLKAQIKEVYGDIKGDALMDEIGAGRFERAMGERFQKLLAKSPEVRSWWRKVLHALARAWKGMARTVGGNRVDLKKIEKMDPEEAIEALTAQMLEGRRLGEGGDEAGWNYVSFRDDNIRVDHKWTDGQLRFSIGGVKGASQMGIKGAGDAEAMEKAGKDREEIWRKTGWWRAKDGQWRVELPDIRTKNSASIKKAWKELHPAQGEGHAMFLRDLIDAEELFKAYPEMEDMKVFAYKNGKGDTYASYNPETDSIDVFGVKTASDLMLRRSDLTHEIQHKIQVEEGFAKGGSPESAAEFVKNMKSKERIWAYKLEVEEVAKELGTSNPYEIEKAILDRLGVTSRDEIAKLVKEGWIPDQAGRDKGYNLFARGYDKEGYEEAYNEYLGEMRKNGRAGWWEGSPQELYKRLAGEVEARNAEERLYMSPEERAATPPWATEDVSEDRQIIRFSRKQMNALAKSKVGEWVEGTSADGIRNAVEKRIQEGMPEGEYRFKNAEDRSRLVREAVKFYKRFAQKTVMLSDGRCVYFVPDARARERGLTNEEAWAEYAIHAVTSSGKRLEGKEYAERLYNASKAQNIWRIENILKAERCEVQEAQSDRSAGIAFYGKGVDGKVIRIITRLDEANNIYADLSEVTVVTDRKAKRLPPRKPLAEVVGAAQYRGGLPTGDAESISQQGGGAQGEIRPSIKKREEREKGVGAQTDSQQFKRWFADSKVVDENGEPLVVYRRDNEGFNVFDVNKTQQNDAGWLGKGFYFYGDRREAESATGYGKNLRKFYLKAENPYYITQEEYNRLVEADDPHVSAEFAKRLTEEGYDSVYWNGDGRKEWMVLEPTQIKSATDNIGTFDPGNPDIRYSRASRKTKEEEKFAAAVGGLTARGKNGTLAAVDQKRLTAVMRGLGSGELKHPRFTREEAAASGGTEHERLWNYILSLESPDIHAGGAEAVGGGEGGADPQGGGWLGRLRRMATRYEGDPKEIAAGEHKYLDRGAESSVYDAGDGTVVKVRKLPLNSADGVKDALAKLVYHNYLFPKDAYTLRDIAVWDNNGYDQFYLILEQPLVTPKTDAAGNIVAPSEGQIFEALKKANRRFRMHDEALERRAEDEFDTTDGDGSSADFVPAARKIAYTDQFVVYDFKPGRNTFIDAETGEVRFIDPRVEVNDPGAGFSVSRFGKRKSVNGTASFEGAPSGEMEGVRYSRRGGKRRDEVYDDVLRAVRAGGQRVAAGRSERTEAGFDAGAALWMEREGQLGKSQDGSMTLSYSEALRLYRAMSASAHMPKVLEKMPHLATRDRKGRLRLNAAAFGIVDKSDLEAVKAGLKKDGMFLHEDPSWRLHNDFEEVRAMKEMSEQALAEEMEKLAEARIKGKMSGGGRTAVNILAKEIGRIACELPVTAGAPQSLKDLRKLGLGIAKELGDPKGELGKEAREAARWWREQDPVRKDPTATKSEDIAESELWAEMFGMFLANPMALQERAPNVYGKMVEAIAGNEKLAEAWNGLRRTRDAEGPHERVMRDIERQWSVNEQQAYKELLAELDKPIGKWGKRTRARLLLELHSAEGPAVMWVTDAVRERLAELKRLKKAGKIGEEEYDLLAGGAKRELEKMRVALLHKQRGGGTGRLYALDFASGVMEDVARDGVDMGDLRRYMYAKSVRDGLHQKGKAAALGMDPREAQKVLEELEGRLGADGWAKLETAAKRFQATREQHLLENEFVLEAFGRDLVNYWKMNASYVRSERTWTAEEVSAYEAARSDWMKRHPGESTVIAEIEALMDMHVAKGSGTAGSAFMKPLVGSNKAVKDPIAATLENDLRIIEFAQRNHWACQLAESAKSLGMEGFAVMEDRGGGGKLRGSNRYGSVTFLKDGKRMTLVMPKVVAEGFEHDSRGVSKLVKLNRWASAILTQYSPRFALRNIWRNRASNANNIAWMGEGRLVTGMGMVGMRPVARLATFLLERAASHLPDRFARNALMNVLYGSKTNVYWEAEATRLAKMMQDPKLLRRRAEEANSLMLQGKSAEAQRLWDDIQKCQEFMKLPIFAGVRKQIMGESGKAELDELMRSLNLETNFDGTKLTGLKRAKRWMQRRAETVKRFNDFEEARVKLIALLAAQHEAELAQARGEAAPRSRDEITYQVATMSGSPRYENRGRAMNYIEFACGPFMNVGMKGAWRTVESMRYDPKAWWTKAAGRIAGRLATGVLWMGGGYKVLAEILRESAGDDDEKKKRVDAFERFGRRMAHALANVSDYRLRNYDIVPVGLYGKWSTLAISMPRGDEDRLLMPTVDLLANGLLGSEKAQEMGFALPTDLNYTASEAVQNTVFGSGLIPDPLRRGLLWTVAQDAILPWFGRNPYNSFTQRGVYNQADVDAAWEEPWNMAKKVGKQVWNDLGGQVVMPATTWDEDEGAYDDQGQWALSGAEEGEAGCMPIGGKTIFQALHSIPFLSSAASGLITFQNGGNERIARRLEKYRRDDSAPLRAAAQRVADEVIEAVRANGEDFDYSEMLAARVAELGLPEEDAEIIEGLAFKKVQGIAEKMGSEFDPIGKTLRKMSNDEKMYRRAKRQVEAEGWDGDFD